jgi:hypothetical protein
MDNHVQRSESKSGGPVQSAAFPPSFLADYTVHVPILGFNAKAQGREEAK